MSAKRELEELRQQPEINKKSQHILKVKESYVPIHERFERVINDGQVKKSQKQAEIIEELIVKDPDAVYPSFKPKTNGEARQRDFNQFI